MEINYRDKDLVYFSGKGALSSKSATVSTRDAISIGVLINVKTGTIVRANALLCSPLALDFFRGIVTGRSIEKEYDDIIEDFERIQTHAKKPLIVAFKSAYDKYKNYIEKSNIS